jgi:DNA ligase 1
MFKTLYKRTSTGAIQQWTIEIDGCRFRTLSGQKDGAIVISEFTECKSKNSGKINSTTPEQQALFEAQAKYKKKLETGYKENIEEIDSVDLLKPILAKEYKDHRQKIKFPVISSMKLDGVRVNALDSGLYSRNGKPFVSVPHILDALQPVFQKYPEYVIDGELFNLELQDNFDKIISLVRKTKPTVGDLIESASLIKLYVFDVFRKDGKEVLPAIERKQVIREIEKAANYPSIVALDYVVCYSQAELDNAYGTYLESGAEGQMINAYDAVYEHKRTSNLLKRKEFQDAEFKIIDVVEGKGNRTGCAIFVLESKNGQFNSPIKGSIDYIKKIFENRQSYIGKITTVRFQNYTPGGVPRFPSSNGIIRDFE